jgi:hypothetical protein
MSASSCTRLRRAACRVFLLTGRSDALHVTPWVYLVEAEDGQFRASVVFRVEDGGWLGRYLYHLSTSYTLAQLRNAQPEVLSTLQQELTQGADILRSLKERDARGELGGRQRRATFGSYHLVGSRVAGVVPACIVTYPGAGIQDEDPDHVVLRSNGKPDSGVREGALAYGVHCFHRHQFHTFKVEASQR